MTYYINDGKKKRYLYEFIKDNDKLKNIDFWEKYLQFVVDLDIKNDITKKELITEESAKAKLKFAAFSNVLTIINNMVNFNFEESFINKFIDFAEKNYSLTKEQISQIQDLITVWKTTNDSQQIN